MPYRLRYNFFVDFVPAGIGLGIEQMPGPGAAPAGPAQTIAFFNGETATLPPVTNTFLSGDVTTLTNAMAADASSQLNANLGRIQGFASGGG
jgi:hypothetical protein